MAPRRATPPDLVRCTHSRAGSWTGPILDRLDPQLAKQGTELARNGLVAAGHLPRHSRPSRRSVRPCSPASPPGIRSSSRGEGPRPMPGSPPARRPSTRTTATALRRIASAGRSGWAPQATGLAIGASRRHGPAADAVALEPRSRFVSGQYSHPSRASCRLRFARSLIVGRLASPQLSGRARAPPLPVASSWQAATIHQDCIAPFPELRHPGGMLSQERFHLAGIVPQLLRRQNESQDIPQPLRRTHDARPHDSPEGRLDGRGA
jgi:hypothetical protein